MDLLEIFDATWRTVIVRFLLNFIMVFIVARFLYNSRGKGNLDYSFTYISISAIVFIVCILLSQVPVEMGFALGLFAIFSVIRFRSVQATPRELTYLFICLGLGLMNALLKLDVPIIKIVANNLLIILTIGITEYLLFRNRIMEKIITYDRLDLLTNDKRSELEEDLRHRFGVNHIKQIQIGDIDTFKNRVKLRVIIRDKERQNFKEK
ncbi:MAG: DUF4956 domain-containing protein [Bacteroidales bacterium]|nr:DUF4956 domain-containing protein [Bacteroidales bacterium]